MPFPIRQYLDRLTGLNRTERAVLTQIVELAEHGGPRGCYATNATLGERVQASPRTICRLVRGLLRAQLLVQHGQTSHRTLQPSPILRACYASSTPTACWAATQALGQQLATAKMALGSPPTTPANPDPALASQGLALPPTEAPALASSGRAYKETRKEEKEEENNENLALRAELVRAKKKIEGLEQQLAQQAAGESALTTSGLLAFPSEQAPASPTGGAAGGRGGAKAAAYDPSALPPQLTLPFATPAFRTAWIEYRHYYFEQYGQRFTGGRWERAVLEALSELAAHDEARALVLINQAIRKGWKHIHPLDSPTNASPHAPFRTNRPGAATANPRQLPATPNFANDRA